MRMLIGIVVTGVSMVGSSGLAAVSPTPEEMAACRAWVGGHLRTEGARVPFSFVYGGRSSAELLPGWLREQSTEARDAHRTKRTATWTDPETGLVVRCESVEYRDFPVVEGPLYFRNGGTTDTPILESIQALDVGLKRAEDGEFLLHHAVGSPYSPRDYEPLATTLGPGSRQHIAAEGGRPTSSDLCYFDLEIPDAGGMIVAVGWPGQWASDWERDAGRGLRIRIGQELTHFKLLPGEEVRSPLVALQFWQGAGRADDWLRAQNLWRRWFIAHNIPRPGGELPPMLRIGGSAHTNMMVGATEENQKRALDVYIARGFKPDLWWMDAGWYPCNGDWTCTGTWEPDATRFPRGLEPLAEYIRERGVKTVLWFEPERVRAGTRLDLEHPEWLLHAGDGDRLLDFGNPEAWQWALDYVDGMVTSLKLDIYRQDFNMGPLAHWRANDAPDRQGITEIRYVTGLLAYWDELLRRHPGLLYDNCAGGGRRNDLESVRRGVPYTKSDYADDPVAVQGETYGISLWLPYFGAVGLSNDDVYASRSRLAHVLGAGFDDEAEGIDLSELARRLEEWRVTVPCYWGDFWPLTPYSIASDAWLAWQFDLPDTGEGVVQAYRRTDCPDDSLVVKLRGLDPEATYVVKDVDAPEAREVPGAELIAEGLTVTIPTQPGAAIVTYRRL